MAKPDPFDTTTSLIQNAIGSAKVLGENQRVARLVASSLGRLMAEADAADGGGGHALLDHAQSCIGPDDVKHIPWLMQALATLASQQTRH